MSFTFGPGARIVVGDQEIEVAGLRVEFADSSGLLEADQIFIDEADSVDVSVGMLMDEQRRIICGLLGVPIAMVWPNLADAKQERAHDPAAPGLIAVRRERSEQPDRQHTRPNVMQLGRKTRGARDASQRTRSRRRRTRG